MAGGDSRWVLALPAVGLLLVVALAWQAIDSTRGHRLAAEEVLRDYARLAADELVRRGANQVGYYGIFPLTTTLASALEQPELPLSAGWAAIDSDARAVEQKDLVQRLFRLTDDHGVEASPPWQDGVTESWLRARATQAIDASPTPFAVVHGVFDGARDDLGDGVRKEEARSFAMVSVGDGAAIVGFELDRQALADRLRSAFARAPLLPASLAGVELDRQPLRATVLDPATDNLLIVGAVIDDSDPYREHLSARVPFGDTYQGVLEGFTAVVTLDPAAAADLVIGGLPGSRLPLLVGLSMLAMAFVVATALAARRARLVARLRTDFIARVSHELRTPLTQIRMFTETLLLERLRDDGERRRALTIIDREARRLTHLVDNILSFSHGQHSAVAGGQNLHSRRQPIAPSLARSVERVQALVDEQTLVVDNELGDDLEVVFDRDAVHQILLNLVDNAIKYGPADQTIRLRWQRVGDAVQLSVADQGPGIPRPQRERIWRDYERLQRPLERSVAGTGIGLSVVRDLVVAHGGCVWVEDSGLAPAAVGGARFVVELPLAGRTVGEQ